MVSKSSAQHFILTRFNLLLWNKDKEGNKVRPRDWLEHRFALFEQYCLPSMQNQSCKDFEWIVLFDSRTPDYLKKKIGEYQKGCPQQVPVYVEPLNGRYFADIFRLEVVKKLNSQHVITTYLDNDALSINFVKDLQKRSESLSNGTVINYTDGYQYYTDHSYLMQIHYPRNHFMSVIEEGNPATLKTIYGYGTHYYIDKIHGVNIENVRNQPMWCEVIHEKNIGNDAYFLNARLVSEAKGFGLKVPESGLKYGLGMYLFRYLPRYIKTFVRRIGYRLEDIGNEKVLFVE